MSFGGNVGHTQSHVEGLIGSLRPFIVRFGSQLSRVKEM